MQGTPSIAHQRALLSTIRTQFSSDVQELKQISIDRIVANILFLTHESGSKGAQQIRHAFRKESGGLNLNHTDVEQCLCRLHQAGTIELSMADGKTRYRLTDEARSKIRYGANQAEQAIEQVVQHLFSTDIRGALRYRNCFLEILARIHAELGEENARLITDQINGYRDGMLSPILDEVIARDQSYQSLDQQLIEQATEQFFESSDPNFRLLSMSMAQNYFVTRMLGLDSTGAMLSQELFGETTFLLDTNVIISALEPCDRYHGGSIALIECLQHLGAEIRVTRPTLDELERWVASERIEFARVIDDIPEPLMAKVGSPFVARYKVARDNGIYPTLDYLFENFANPERTLEEKLKVQVYEEQWFHEVVNTEEVKVLSAQLRSLRPLKPQNAVLHDALILLWINRCRESESDRAWLVTNDRSLPRCYPDQRNPHSLAITMVALLQWVSPIASGSMNESEFASAFACLVSERLLPRSRFFDLEDFRVFGDLAIETKSLPPSEVEACLRTVKSAVGTIDLSEAKDRERLYFQVNKYFKRPDTEYKKAITELEQMRRKEAAEYEAALAKAEKEARQSKLRAEVLERESQEREQAEALCQEGKRRFYSATLVLVCVELLIIETTRRYLFRTSDVSDIIEGMALSFAILTAAAGFYWKITQALLGEERLRAMHPFFARLFHATE